MGRAGEGGRVCSVGMLKGLYLWTFDGYANFGGNLVPKAVMQGLGSTEMVHDVQHIRHCEHRGHDYYRRHRSGRNLYGRTGLHGHPSVPNGPSFNIYVGPGAQKFWFTQTAGGAGSGAGLVLERRHVCQGGKSFSASRVSD